MIPPGSRRGQRGNRRAAIILIACLAVVAFALLLPKVWAAHHPQPANPGAPLVGVIDRAKATAGAADARNRQLENLIGGATSTTDPLSP